MKDNINPSHYKQGNIEVIDFILDQKSNYLEGNVIKYISRYKTKTSAGLTLVILLVCLVHLV